MMLRADVPWRGELCKQAAARALVDVCVVSFLYFFLCGTDLNQSKPLLRLFTVLYVPVAILTVLIEAIFSTRNKVFDATRSTGGARPLHAVSVPEQTWISASFRALPLAAVMVLALLAGVEHVNSERAATVITIAGTLLSIVLATFILAWTTSKRDVLLAMNSAAAPHSIVRFISNYAVPWSAIAAVVAGLLANKYFLEGITAGAPGVAVMKVAFALGGTAFVIAMWIYCAVQKQALADLRENLLQIERKDRVSLGDALFLIHLGVLVVIGIVFLAGRLLSLSHLSVMQVVAADVIVAACAAVLGALLGVCSDEVSRQACLGPTD